MPATAATPQAMPDMTGLCYTSPHEPTEAPERDASPKHQPLGVLRPTPLKPSRLPKRRRTRAVAALKHIESIEVSRNSDRTDRKVYYVDMFFPTQQSRIPVHRHFRPSGSDPKPPKGGRKRTPSATIQVAYDDFLQLRHDAYELARASHLFDACGFCHQMVQLTTASAFMPRWNSHWSKSNDEVCAMLAIFLMELLNVAVQVPVAEAGSQCHGQEHIPRLLQTFLRSHEQERRSM